MHLLSPEEVAFLEWMDALPKGYIPGNKLSADQHDRMDSMVRKQLVLPFTLVPPGMEAKYFGDQGLTGFRISPDGRDALSLHQQACQQAAEDIKDRYLQEQRENKRDRKDSIRLIVEVVGVILSFVTGVVVESRYEILSWLRSVFH